MYAITLASALVLLGDWHKSVVAVAAAGVLVGWPFAALAAAPLVLYSLLGGGFLLIFLAGLLTTLCTMVSSAALVIYSAYYVSTSFLYLLVSVDALCYQNCNNLAQFLSIAGRVSCSKAIIPNNNIYTVHICEMAYPSGNFQKLCDK
jgi:hypothetical protein